MATADSCSDGDKRSSVKTLSAKLAKIMKALELSLKDSDDRNISTLRQEARETWDLYEKEVVDVQASSSEDRSEMNRTFQRTRLELDTLLERARQRISEKLESESSTSNRRSRVSSQRRRELAQLRLSQVKRRQELERRQQELGNQQAEVRRELEIQEIEDDLARSELEESSDSGSSACSSDVVGLPETVQSSGEKVQDYLMNGSPNVSKGTNLRADAAPFVSRGYDDAELFSGLMAMTNSVQESLNLPKPELLTFNGNPTDYCKFISNFETNIESRVTDDRLKLSYLIQYCQSDARRSIEDCVVLPSTEGYIRAKQILRNRYGKPHLVARSHVDRLINGSLVKPNDVQGLMNLSLDMEKCQITLSQIGFVSDINNTENLRKIVRRLPMHIRSRWAERASKLIEQGAEPNFNDLLTFVQERVQVSNTMYGQDLASVSKIPQIGKVKSTPRNPFSGEKRVSLSTTASGQFSGNNSFADRQRGLSCVYCKEAHKLMHCERFKSADRGEKLNVIKTRGMCENCLNFKHSAKFCRKGSCCEVAGCNEKHHTMLHNTESPYVNQNSVLSNCCAAAETAFTQNKVSLRIIPVIIKNGHSHVKTYALLDEGSDVSLCTEGLVKRLGATGTPHEFTITTVNTSNECRKGIELDLKVSSIDENDTVILNRVWSVERLPISLKSLPDQSVLGKWKHLSGINLPRINEGQVELLIGSDTPEAFWVEEERRGKRGEPYAIRSILGWSILGPTGKYVSNSSVNVNFQHTSSVQMEIDRLWKTDFPDCRSDSSAGMSIEDRRALSIMEKTIEKDGAHYKLGLPWRDQNVCLPNNRVTAITRLSHLKRKLQRDNSLYNMYKNTMNDYIRNGYAMPVRDKGQLQSGKVWYLPHHPVVNPNKPGKVRIVYDCAAKYRGTSLNDNILQGPDLMNSIVGVLIRFRKEPVALVADIEAMFHQVKVRDSDRDALRFLWWPGGNMEKQPLDYCMTVHLFGATSSPSCAGYSLKRTARDNADEFSEEAAKTIEHDFYVDDLLKSVPDAKTGIRLTSELRNMLSRGGFRLTKWLSNSKRVMDSIPCTERAELKTNVDIENDPQFERTLGLQWNVQRDQFVFDVCLQEKSQTRRSILSVASSLYDPLGLVAPVTLIPKLILQNACRQKLQWDDQISDMDAEKWSNWLISLPELSKVSIDRCLKPCKLDNMSSRRELHMFSDASESAYGSAVYLKIYDVFGNSKCSLVMGKSRLAPIKSISIPRLELAAAVLSVKLYELVRRELDLTINEKYFWTDSMIVLGYIRNEKRRFKTFVANRLAIIHDVTMPDDWRYVPTKLNPADLASRGVHPHNTGMLAGWLNGPEFLQNDSSHWPEIEGTATADNDPEIKTEIRTHVTQGKCSTGLDNLLVWYSDWHKLQRAIGWLLRFKMHLIKRYLKSRGGTGVTVELGNLTVKEIRGATKAVLILLQKNAFCSDIRSVIETGRVPKASSLVKLSPVYTEGLLRVGGRLDNADIHGDVKHPVILPSNHNVSRILIMKYHELNAHMGAHHVLSLIRQKYWIVHGLQTVKSVVNKCINCKRRQQRPEAQQMGRLPVERLTPDKAPFTYVGVDFFGPIYVKSGRRHLKRYGCLFTCLTTRAVHIEIAHSLDTDSFVCALQRFVSRRGRPEKIFSDNGTNLRAGERELRDSIQKWNQSRLSKYFLQQEITWVFNPPYASHMGGVWERLVRSIKNALKSIVREQLLNDEALVTLATEVEKIMNDRPITQVSDDPRDPEPLSPNKLLTLRSNSCVPPGVFDKGDNYCKRWWRQVQYLANLFWRRWTREYMPTLQVRQKWQNIQRNVAVNDLVLVLDEQSTRGRWPLGLVLEVSKGRDGLVRSCRVKINGSEKVRPITRLCLLEQSVS